MHFPKDVEQILEQIVALVQKEFKGLSYELFLFGSWANGQAMERSDIDVGIDSKDPLPADAWFRLEEQLEELPTLRGIDLVDMSCVDEQFRSLALKQRRTLYVQ